MYNSNNTQLFQSIPGKGILGDKSLDGVKAPENLGDVVKSLSEALKALIDNLGSGNLDPFLKKVEETLNKLADLLDSVEALKKLGVGDLVRKLAKSLVNAKDKKAVLNQITPTLENLLKTLGVTNPLPKV